MDKKILKLAMYACCKTGDPQKAIAFLSDSKIKIADWEIEDRIEAINLITDTLN